MLSAQTERDSTKSIKISERIPAMLELEISLKQSLSIGYANCFEAKVLKVNRGIVKDSMLLITVLAGDKENYEKFCSGNDSTVFIIEFVFNKSNEDFSIAYITGFVDSEKRSWRVVSVVRKN